MIGLPFLEKYSYRQLSEFLFKIVCHVEQRVCVCGGKTRGLIFSFKVMSLPYLCKLETSFTFDQQGDREINTVNMVKIRLKIRTKWSLFAFMQYNTILFDFEYNLTDVT